MLIALIENDVAFSDHFVRRFVHSYFVGLQTISADARVNVSFANRYPIFCRPGNAFPVTNDAKRFRALRALLLSGDSRPDRLILLQRIYVRRVGNRVLDFAIDRIGLLRARCCNEEQDARTGDQNARGDEDVVYRAHSRSLSDPRTCNSQSRLLRSDEPAAGAPFSLSKCADANMRARWGTSVLQIVGCLTIFHLSFVIFHCSFEVN